MDRNLSGKISSFVFLKMNESLISWNDMRVSNDDIIFIFG